MILTIECIIMCLLFTLVVYLGSRDPLQELYNYPPAIQERVRSLPEYADKIPTEKKKIGKKLAAMIIIVILFSLLLKHVNGCSSFSEGFISSFILWSVVNAYDAIVMDIIWFCHDPHFIIKGTEDMVSDYHDYWFHIKGSLFGEVLAVIVCVLVGLVIQFVL